jgi:C1A family cysteine protease
MLVIERNQNSDLSEAELLFCGGGSCQGWWPDNAIDYLGDQGVAQEECFPYQAHELPCQPCSRRDGEAIKITRTTTLFDVEQRKDYLAFVGPMIAGFTVHADFYAYSSGVYSHVTGQALGGHCVEVIGYDDFLGCWICKNSWGAGWGEGGFFKIAYGQCEIDSTYPFWGMSGTDWWS